MPGLSIEVLKTHFGPRVSKLQDLEVGGQKKLETVYTANRYSPSNPGMNPGQRRLCEPVLLQPFGLQWFKLLFFEPLTNIYM